jgi:hypothetical protein
MPSCLATVAARERIRTSVSDMSPMAVPRVLGVSDWEVAGWLALALGSLSPQGCKNGASVFVYGIEIDRIQRNIEVRKVKVG